MVTNWMLSLAILFLGDLGGEGRHHHIRADEIAGIGLGVAALIGAVGYLVLRRRGSKQN